MGDPESILQFDHVAAGRGQDDCSADDSINFVLQPGALAIIRAADAIEALGLADTAMGFREPAKGIVRFRGNDWRASGIAQASALRGTIGRISLDYGWISNLDLEENITLGQRHATRRPLSEIRSEARRWAQAFGLPDGIPPGRPAELPADVLCRAACVRAFLGERALVVVALPHSAEWSALEGPIIDACQFLRGRKTAVLLIGDVCDISRRSDLQPTIELSLVPDSTTLLSATSQPEGLPA